MGRNYNPCTVDPRAFFSRAAANHMLMQPNAAQPPRDRLIRYKKNIARSSGARLRQLTRHLGTTSEARLAMDVGATCFLHEHACHETSAIKLRDHICKHKARPMRKASGQNFNHQGCECTICNSKPPTHKIITIKPHTYKHTHTHQTQNEHT